MKFLHQCLVLGAIASIATSCSQDAPWKGATGEEGKISLKLKTDLSVKTSTRADDSESPVKPDGERFAIRLENVDGSYVKEWENLNKFNAEEGFPRGNYTVTAYYGKIEEQGFIQPHYLASEQIAVVPGETTETSLTASLANSMVSIRYTESFINYFSAYSASLVADGIATPVAFARNETRPAYVKPGKITVNFNITNTEGQEITVSPATFTADPRRHYIITATVNQSEQQGVMALEVQFDDSTVGETVDILLTDELYTSAPPAISAFGFEPETTISTFESVGIESNPEFHVVAYGGKENGGIKEATFFVEVLNGHGVLPAFNGEVDLVSADAATLQLIEQSKLKFYGFSGKEEVASNKMAVVQMKEFIENLAPGEYRLSMRVTDDLGRVGESNYLMAKIDAIEYTFIPEFNPKFMSKEISLIVYTNYEGAQDEFSFKIENKLSEKVPGRIVSVDPITSNKPSYPYAYRFLIAGEDEFEDTDWDVALCYPNKDDMEVRVDVDVPLYTAEVDAYAKKVVVKITTDNNEDLKMMVEQAKLKLNGSTQFGSSSVTRDPDNGFITISGLTPSTDNDVVVAYGHLDLYAQSMSFTTEAELGVPNGDFEDLVETINTTINQGGEWARTAIGQTHQTTLTMEIKEPKGWHTSNSTTCNLNASNLNSWFTVPSVYNTTLMWNANQPKVDVIQSAHSTRPSIYTDYKGYNSDNAMVIRNVAWDNNGTVKTDKGTYGVGDYYCHNQPSISNRSRGSLVLGEGTADGASFVSRPINLKGQYIYKRDQSDSSERGLVVVKILSGNKTIASGEVKLAATDDKYAVFECPLTYTAEVFKAKATTLQISIYSSDKESEIKTTNHCNKDECCSRGSFLVIDALEFEY